MPKTGKYVLAKDRVRVVLGGTRKEDLNPTLILRVLTADEGSVGPLAWRSVIDDYRGGPSALGDTANIIRAAMRLACEAARDLCAEAVRAKCLACSGVGCEYCRHQIAAIRKLEL